LSNADRRARRNDRRHEPGLSRGQSSVERWAVTDSLASPNGDPRVEIRAADSLTEPERAQFLRLRDQIDVGPPVLRYHFAPKPWRVLVWKGEQLVSHVGIVERTISVAARPIKVGGIASVGTHPDHRGRGFAAAAMNEAMTFICGALGAESGFLLCRDHVTGFYRRLGWGPVAGPVVFDQPEGRITWPLAAMARPCHKTHWPQGAVDLCGLPW
jgi:GNAT superfamily N-acetyltransferase